MDLVWIPDTQVRQDVPIEHIKSAGQYLLKHKPDVIMIAGDWWDMPSLSKFANKLEIDGARINADIESGKDAMIELMLPIMEYNQRRKLQKKRGYFPKCIFITGNHDPMVRIPRLISDHPILEGFVTDDCAEWLEDSFNFEVIPYQEIYTLEDIRFSHYFSNSWSAKKGNLSGTIENLLKAAGFSFCQGHQQGLKIGKRKLGDGTERLGIVAGSFYDHYETYEGIQGCNNWHGIIHLRNVSNGTADIQEISIESLKREY